MGSQRLIASPAAGLLWQLRAVNVGLAEVAMVEHRFHPTRKWRFDLAFPDHMVAVEVDGGIYVGGRHVRGQGVEGDCEKVSEAAALGWRVLRVTPRHIESGQAVTWLEKALLHGI